MRKAININNLSNSVCQPPSFHSKTVWEKNNMHVFIHRKQNCLAGKLTYKEPYFTHKDFSLIWQLWIIPPHPPIPLFLSVLVILWLHTEGDKQYKNPSIWLLTKKKLKMYSVPSALWLTNNVGWWRNCTDNRAGWNGAVWKMQISLKMIQWGNLYEICRSLNQESEYTLCEVSHTTYIHLFVTWGLWLQFWRNQTYLVFEVKSDETAII